MEKQNNRTSPQRMPNSKTEHISNSNQNKEQLNHKRLPSDLSDDCLQPVGMRITEPEALQISVKQPPNRQLIPRKIEIIQFENKRSTSQHSQTTPNTIHQNFSSLKQIQKEQRQDKVIDSQLLTNLPNGQTERESSLPSKSSKPYFSSVLNPSKTVTSFLQSNKTSLHETPLQNSKSKNQLVKNLIEQESKNKYQPIGQGKYSLDKDSMIQIDKNLNRASSRFFSDHKEGRGPQLVEQNMCLFQNVMIQQKVIKSSSKTRLVGKNDRPSLLDSDASGRNGNSLNIPTNNIDPQYNLSTQQLQSSLSNKDKTKNDNQQKNMTAVDKEKIGNEMNNPNNFHTSSYGLLSRRESQTKKEMRTDPLLNIDNNKFQIFPSNKFPKTSHSNQRTVEPISQDLYLKLHNNEVGSPSHQDQRQKFNEICNQEACSPSSLQLSKSFGMPVRALYVKVQKKERPNIPSFKNTAPIKGFQNLLEDKKQPLSMRDYSGQAHSSFGNDFASFSQAAQTTRQQSNLEALLKIDEPADTAAAPVDGKPEFETEIRKDKNSMQQYINLQAITPTNKSNIGIIQNSINNNTSNPKSQQNIPPSLNLAIFKEYMPFIALPPDSKKGGCVVYSNKSRIISNSEVFGVKFKKEEERYSKIVKQVKQQICKIDDQVDPKSLNLSSSSLRLSYLDSSYQSNVCYTPLKKKTSENSQSPDNKLKTNAFNYGIENSNTSYAMIKGKNLSQGIQGKHINLPKRQNGSPYLKRYLSTSSCEQEIKIASEKVFLHYLQSAQQRKAQNTSQQSSFVNNLPSQTNFIEGNVPSVPIFALNPSETLKVMNSSKSITNLQMSQQQEEKIQQQQQQQLPHFNTPQSESEGQNMISSTPLVKSKTNLLTNSTLNFNSKSCSIFGFKDQNHMLKNVDPDRNAKIMKRLFGKTNLQEKNPFKTFASPRKIIFSKVVELQND